MNRAWALLTVLVGLGSGLASALFLFGLDAACRCREQNPFFLLALPLLGGVTAYVYRQFGRGSEHGQELIHDALADKTLAGKSTADPSGATARTDATPSEPRRLPWQLAPLVLVGTWLSHLGGASVGREGTAVQIACTLADNLWQRVSGRRINSEVPHEPQASTPPKPGASARSVVTALAISAGFASVFGTPLTGILYGVELGLRRQAFIAGSARAHWLRFATPLCAASALIAWLITILFNVHHTRLPLATPFLVWDRTITDWLRLGALLLALGASCTLLRAGYSYVKQSTSARLSRTLPNPIQRAAVVGAALLPILWLIPQGQSLGLAWQTEAFAGAAAFWAGPAKLLLTAASLAGGFVGGEVTPIFVAGSCVGASLGGLVGIAPELGAAVMMCSLFGSISRARFALVVLGYELFSAEVAAYCLVVALLDLAFERGLHLVVCTSRVRNRNRTN
jgi:H+/Cl- antiporter ClcA